MPEEQEEKQKQLSIQRRKIRGGIEFPLDWEDISAIKASFMGIYIVNLVNGSAVINDIKIQATSVAIATHRVFSGIIGVLSAYCDNGVVNVISTSNSDNSQVNLIVIY
jgi:hypothetical protein